jgi:ribosomal protein S26
MAAPKKEPTPETAKRKTPKRKTLVRGADGALYLLTDKDLAPFKLPEEKAEKVTQILKNTQENPVVAKLSRRVIREMDLARAVSVSIVCVSGEIFVNTVRKH